LKLDKHFLVLINSLNFSNQRFVRALLLLFVAGSFSVFGDFAFCDDIDDVESGVDAAISESDAAQADSESKKDIELQEQDKLKEAKLEQKKLQKSSLIKEINSKKEIAEIEKHIASMQIEQSELLKAKNLTLKKMALADQRLSAKRSEDKIFENKLSIAKAEKEEAALQLNKRLNEEQKLNHQIKNSQAEIQKLRKEIVALKEKSKSLDIRLKALREEDARTVKKQEPIQALRDSRKMGIKRSISSVNNYEAKRIQKKLKLKKLPKKIEN
jgi:hypothetical protein